VGARQRFVIPLAKMEWPVPSNCSTTATSSQWTAIWESSPLEPQNSIWNSRMSQVIRAQGSPGTMYKRYPELGSVLALCGVSGLRPLLCGEMGSP
jgi:hypothetical protein